MQPAHASPPSDPVLPLWANDSELAALEQAWQAASDASRPALQLALAWQLRQRDHERASALADALQAEPDMAPRLQLLRAEIAYLAADFATAASGATQALAGFKAAQDALGCADVHGLRAALAFEQGDMAAYQAALQAMQAAAEAGAEPQRRTLALVDRARVLVFSDLPASERLWRELGSAAELPMHAALQSHLENYHATVAGTCGDFARAIAHYMEVYRQALASGQLQLAVWTGCNIGTCFNSLNDHHAALEWAQLALEQARQAGMNRGIGAALTLQGDSLRFLQRIAPARDLLLEALAQLAGQPRSRPYGVALLRLGDLLLADDQPAAALQRFHALQGLAADTGGRDLQINAMLGQARAQLALGEVGAAAALAQAVLVSAHAWGSVRIAALELLASLHERHPGWPAPPGMMAASPALHHLQAAQALAAELSGYALPASLLDALARAHAAQGDDAQAYRFARQANEARRTLHSQAASHRALALQVRRDTLRLHAEAEQQRQQTAAQAQRSALLQEANGILERLGAIGRDIIGKLDEQEVCSTLHRHTATLLDAHTFAVYKLQAEERCLSRIFGLEDGRALGRRVQDLDDPHSKAARCARERRDVSEGNSPTAPGTQEMRSAMFTPMLVGERLLGVLTIQSPQANAYGERELAMLRSLGAFAAIGLANAHSLQQLRQTQALLVQQDKLASLGQLIASVGQEIHTPMAVIKAAGRSMGEALDQLLNELPQLLETLDVPAQALFVRLLRQMQPASEPLNTRAERARLRQLSQALHEAGIAESRRVAELLLPLGAAPLLEELLPLLRHPERARVLALARQLALLVSSTGNVNAAADRAARVVHALKAYARVEHGQQREPSAAQASLATVLALQQRGGTPDGGAT